MRQLSYEAVRGEWQVRDVHSISSKKVTFAEQVRVSSPHGSAEFSVKKKNYCLTVKCKNGTLIAEPMAFYQLPSGEWWMEYTPLYTHDQVLQLEPVVGSEFPWMPDYDTEHECIVSHNKKKNVGGDSADVSEIQKYFYRTMFDPDTLEVITDLQAKDLMAA
eukprot:gene28638-35522_t